MKNRLLAKLLTLLAMSVLLMFALAMIQDVVEDRIRNQRNAVQSVVASLAGYLCLDPDSGQQAAGIEINANHLRAVTEGEVTGTARPVHLGKATQVWEVRIEDARGRLVCLSRMTAAVIRL